MSNGVDESVTFEDWWKENNDELYSLGTKEIIALAWEAATKAENERCGALCQEEQDEWDSSGNGASAIRFCIYRIKGEYG